MKTAIVRLLVVVAIATSPLSAFAAEKGNIPRVGLLLFGDEQTSAHLRAAFRAGMEELGYTEGRNVAFVYGFAGRDAASFPARARELAQAKVDVILTASGVATDAARTAAPGIPIVFATIGEPVVSGFVKSLAQPGGNITGISLVSPALNSKRLELTKEALPAAKRIAILQHSRNPANDVMAEEIAPTARAYSVATKSFAVDGPDDFDRAFTAMADWQADAVVVFAEAIFNSNRTQLAAVAAKHKLPMACPYREMAVAGCLFSYGVDLLANFRRAAAYVDKILKGAKAADLPVENPTRFETVINLKAAQAFGVNLPPSLVLRADEQVR